MSAIDCGYRGVKCHAMKPHEKLEVILTFQNHAELLSGAQPPVVAYPSMLANVLPSRLLLALCTGS